MSKVTLESITNAIYGQESSHGTADTSQANYAGARGPMQVTLSTFEGMKSKGLIPSDYQHSNPEHTMEAGRRLVADLYSKFDGDPQKVAAAYYAGEKAVRADGTIADFRDKKNNKAPTTHQYVAQVMGRLGEETQLPAASKERGPMAEVLANWDTQMPAPYQKAPTAMAAREAVQLVQPLPLPTGEGVIPSAVGTAAEGAATQAAAQAAKDTTFMSMARVAPTFLYSAMKAALRPEYPPQAGFRVPAEELKGATDDEQSFLLQAQSPEHLARIKWEIQNNRQEAETLSSNGTGWGIAASIFAGLPEGYVSGVGAARAFAIGRLSSIRMAAAGRNGAAVATALGENVVGNVGMVAVQDQFDPYVGVSDYGFALGMSALGAGLSLPSTFSAGRKLAEFGEQLKLQSAAETLKVREQAVLNLGAEVSPERLQGEAQRLEANAVRQEISRHEAEIPENRRMLGDVEELAARKRREYKEAQAAIQPEKAPEIAQIREESVPLFTRRGDIDPRPETRPAAGKGDAEPRPLPKTSTKALLSRVVNSADAAPEYKAMAERLLGQVRDDIPIFYAASRDMGGTATAGLKPPGGWRSHYNPNEHAIYIQPRDNVQVQVHEVAHALTVHKLTYGFSNPDTAIGALATQVDSLLNRARAEYKARVAEDPTLKSSETEYLMSNQYEFIAGAYMGKGAFTDFLHSIKLDGETSLLSSFVNAIRSLLGLEAVDNTAFTRLLGLADGIADQRLNVTLDPTGLDGAVGGSVRMSPPSAQANAAASSAALMNDPIAKKYGLDLLPLGTPQQQAEVAAIIDLYKRAEAGNYKVDPARLSKLMDTAAFQGAQSISNVMLRSDNPVVRMVAAELLESPSGAAGRRSTASIAKYMNEQKYLGNTLNEVESLYTQYRNVQGVSIVEDFHGGQTRAQFDRLVAEEIESRRPGAMAVASPEQVRLAADALEKAYERMRVAQVEAKTIGWGALPESSVGYMPHKMIPSKVMAMTQEQARALHAALTDQFIQIEGFDATFSDALASKYIDRVRQRALGGFDVQVGQHQVGAADIVEDALQQMGMTQPQIVSMMEKYMRGGAGHTKRRLQLDLSQEHTLADGSTFRLMDLFETNQFNLLRNQARRVSGEVALARHGVMGKPGLKLLRRAMEFGENGGKAKPEELMAFDQAAAEFMGDAFGTQNKLVDRMLQANSLARLGGMGFTQFAEAINGVFHIGAVKTLDSITGIGRLRSEIHALARGEKVDNPIIGSIEKMFGAEFGTQAYKTVFPYDAPDRGVAYGAETVTMADRLLRGGTHLQGKLSLWRTIHSTQQRGMAEGIVRKAAEFIKAGNSDVALRDMGITEDLVKRLGPVDSWAKFEGGQLRELDLTKVESVEAAEEFAQAIHRGVSQIIQGTFLGEQGRWVHDGMMRMLTQFRTFSLTSVEKQWARQVGNVGVYKTLGMMLGAMSLAAPIYMVRTYLASIGREDREEYLEQHLSADRIARATLNYIAMSGLSGDMLDALSAITGVGTPTGGRMGAGGQDFVGNVVAPSAALADDLYKAIQNTKEGTDPHQLVKLLPFSRIPYLIPAVNGLGE